MNKDIITLQDLYAIIEENMKAHEQVTGSTKIKNEVLMKLRQKEQELKLSATDGSFEGREFARSKIYFILGELKDAVNPETVDEIIRQYPIDYYRNIFTGDRGDDIKSPVDSMIEEYFSRYSLNIYDSFDKKLLKLSQIIYQELYGYSIIDELVFDSTLNEVACNRYDFIWIQYMGIKRRVVNPAFKFISEEYYNKIIENRMVSTAREEMNAGEPFINCTLKNGFRVTAARPPLSRYYVVNVRLFTGRDTRQEHSSRFMERKMVKLIDILAGKGRRNIAIVGEQGSGKTMAADELVIKILNDSLSIGLAEYTHELDISGNHPQKNVVELQYGKQFEPSSITEMFFRFNRDIVIYGEVRSPMEAFEMVKAMLRQARGSLFTFHSSSVRRMVHDLRQLLMQTKYYTDYREAQFDVADAVDIVIHIKLDRNTGKRYVYKISEVIAREQDMSFQIHDLFTYEKAIEKYRVNSDGLSSGTINSCMEYEMEADDVVQVMDLFNIGNDEKNVFEYMEGGVWDDRQPD